MIGWCKLLVWGLGISEFELQSRYYVHFWTDAFGKGIKSIIPLAMSEIELLLLFLNGFCIR